MAAFTLSGGSRFPNGTSVGAYPFSNWPNADPKTGAAPVGSAANTQTVAGGQATFTGLAENTRYMAYALVAGEHRYVSFVTSKDVPAYTQTYATAARIHPAQTAFGVAGTDATNVAPFGYTTAAQANALVDDHNLLRNDHLALAQLVNSVIDDLQAAGLLQ